MSNLKSAFSQGLHVESSTKREAFGTLRVEADGRKFRYGKAGAAITVGKNCSGAAAVANHINCSVAAAAVGDTQVSVTVGGTAVTADQYADGFLQINDETGEGYQYTIVSNTACDASGVTIVQLTDPIQVALVAAGSSQASLIPNLWSSVITQASENSMPAGVTVRGMTSGYYGWFQTGGLGVYLASGTPAVGQMLVLSDTDGALELGNATYTSAEPIVAIAAATAGVAGEYKPCFYRID